MRDRVGLVVEGNGDLHRAEDLLLRQAVVAAYVGEQGRRRRNARRPARRRRCVPSAAMVRSAPSPMKPSTIAFCLAEISGPDVEVGVGRADA